MNKHKLLPRHLACKRNEPAYVVEVVKKIGGAERCFG